jgi:hypothetical protein
MMLLSVYANIISWLEQHQLPCLFKQAFHINCPGCGLQRSGIALLKGDLLKSLQLYPALLLILLFFIYLVVAKKFHFSTSFIVIKTGIACIFITILASYIYTLTA